MPRKSPERLPASATPDHGVIVEAVRAAGDPAARPAPSALLERLTSGEARGLTEQTQADLDAALRRKAEIEERLGVTEMSVALGHEGAEDERTAARAAFGVIEAEIAGLKRAVLGFGKAVTSAVTAETIKAHAARKKLAEDKVAERMQLLVNFRAELRALQATVSALQDSAKVLAGLNDVTKVGYSRLNLSDSYASAVFADCPALADALDLSRGKPVSKMESLCDVELRFWGRFMPITLPTESTDMPTSAAAVIIESESTGEFGAMANDKFTANGVEYAAGDLIAPDAIMAWPLKSRMLMARIGRVTIFAEPKKE